MSPDPGEKCGSKKAMGKSRLTSTVGQPTQRRYRFRLSALALAVAVPAFFVLGVLLEQQFQIVPLHDPTSGWSDHIWQNYGRTIVDCAEDARRTNKPIECRFPVHAP